MMVKVTRPRSRGRYSSSRIRQVSRPPPDVVAGAILLVGYSVFMEKDIARARAYEVTPIQSVVTPPS
jgi:hypothetical protein